ncbi:hypothetical protein NP439_06240 [Oceanobacillus jeddahense]|uniref:Uncharacterized protein n=1 Tax=Oceanobacillus jeddahense TaxID=1462527 RepID=A0ABY5JVT2_9BACI|nr:hypothetical protein [Oceanobacillus jeddahense]UUI04259.1 hypothetical protein NP439_06240 [Oceanobacillus jeddahense]
MQPAWQDIVDLTKQYRDIKLEYWLNENLFTLSWWILFITTAGIFIVWVVLLDKKESLRLFFTDYL